MARSTEIIYQEMLSAASEYTSLSGLNNSTASLYRLMFKLQAFAIHTFEILVDVWKGELTDMATNISPGTERWFTSKVREFQYSLSDPQVLAIDEHKIIYPVIDENLRIITQASCITRPDPTSLRNTIYIKVAKGPKEALEPLDNNELNALDSYLNFIKMAGQHIELTSVLSDKIIINANIYYNGQYSKTQILEELKANLQTYLINLQFDGLINYQKIVDVFQATTGIKDVVINEMAGRTNDTLIAEREIFVKEYEPSAGYVTLEEDNTNYTLEKSITWYVE